MARERKFFCRVDAPLERSLFQIKALRLFKEECRFCLTEAIDALLHVADEKQPVLPRKAADDGFLNRTGILIFVDKDIAVLPVQRVADIGQCQCLERAMLQIVKIQQTALFLRGGVERIIGLDQLCQAISGAAVISISAAASSGLSANAVCTSPIAFLNASRRAFTLSASVSSEDIRLFLSSQRGKREIVRRNMQRGIAHLRLLRQILG